jgi:hypothetical protein
MKRSGYTMEPMRDEVVRKIAFLAQGKLYMQRSEVNGYE